MKTQRNFGNTSSTEWLGETPFHWRVLPLFACFDERITPNTGGSVSRVLSLSYGNIKDRDVDSNEGLLPESFDTYNVVEPGDVVLRLTDLQNDQRSLRSGQVKNRGIITSAYTTLGPRQNLDERFAAYLLHGYDLLKVFYAMGGGVRQSLKFADLKHLPICVPPLEEQRAISAFLDRETAEIDALIEKQERLIALLEEKRQAFISHAVTKGLDPTVPMKDRCQVKGTSLEAKMIEASAETSWKTLRLRRVARLVTDKATNSSFDIALENIESGTGRLIESEAEFSTEGVAFQPGDLLFGKLRPYLAKAWVADREGAAVGDFHVLRPKADVDPKFLRYSVLEQQFLDEVNSSTFGAKMPRVSWEFLASMKLALPSYDQQLRIVRYLDRETAEIDALIEKQERLIALLEEKRKAFISHAVTGKIGITGRV